MHYRAPLFNDRHFTSIVGLGLTGLSNNSLLLHVIYIYIYIYMSILIALNEADIITGCFFVT